jgi:hypothetical protein
MAQSARACSRAPRSIAMLDLAAHKPLPGSDLVSRRFADALLILRSERVWAIVASSAESAYNPLGLVIHALSIGKVRASSLDGSYPAHHFADGFVPTFVNIRCLRWEFDC